MVGIICALSIPAVAGCGFYDVAYFAPARGQGAFVTNGERLGVAHKLVESDTGVSGQEQCFLVLAVHQAYTAAAEGGGAMRSTIVQVTVNLVNGSSRPARFAAADARIEVGGRSFAPKWIYRRAARGGVQATRASMRETELTDEVPPDTNARYDVYFELDAYPATAYANATGVPPATGGIPLASLREFRVAWRAAWGDAEKQGSTRFTRGTGYGYGGYVRGYAWGPAWGFGWYYWPHRWPVGIYLRRSRLRTGRVLRLRSPIRIRIR